MSADDDMVQTAQAARRSRTVEWHDPVHLAEVGRSLSGHAYLSALKQKAVPAAPFFLLLGIELEQVEHGKVVLGVDPSEHHYNRIGAVHGGLAAALLDSAIGCAIHSMLPHGRGYATIELKVNYTRAIRLDSGRLQCIGQVLHLGANVATAEARIFDAAERLYACASGSCLLRG